MSLFMICLLVVMGPLLILYYCTGSLAMSSTDLAVYCAYVFLVGIAFLCRHYELETKRRTTEGEMRNLLDALDCGVAKILIDGGMTQTILWANKGFYALVGKSPEEYAQEDSSPSRMLYPDDIEMVFEAFHYHVLRHSNFYLEYRIFHKDGHIIWLGMHSVYIGICNGCPIFLSIMNNITERKKMEEKIEWERKKGLTITKISGELFFEYNKSNDELHFLGNYEPIIGAEYACISNFISQGNENKLIHPDDVGFVQEFFARTLDDNKTSYFKRQLRLLCRNGKYCWFLLYVTVLKREGDEELLIGKLVNVDDIASRADQLGQLAEKDPLTALLNKTACQKYITACLAADQTDGALVLIDIDYFKQFNDHKGHMYGDRVLSALATLMKKLFRSTDILGRFGGDEFILFLRNINVEQTLCLLQRYSAALRTTKLNSNDIPLSVSIGVSFTSLDGRDLASLFAKADQALYRAKAAGRACIATSKLEHGIWFANAIDKKEVA